jgi:integrase
MANIEKRPNGVWRARYYDEAGKQHARHFLRKVDAKAWLDTVTASVIRGDYVDPRGANMLLKTYAAQWEKIQVGRGSTLSIIDNAVRLHINPVLADRRIGSIRQSDIQGLVKTLEAKNLAAGTVRNIYDTAARIFASAVDDRVIPSSPCRRIKLPKDDKGEVVPLTLAQVRSLEAGMSDLGAAVIALAGSGLRIGELLGLDVSDVDFLRRTIRVARQRAQSGELTPPKSKSSDRTVPVGQTLIDALAAYLKEGDRKSGPLFVNAMGRPLTYRQWKPLWKDAADKAKVEATAHALRHFYAVRSSPGERRSSKCRWFLGTPRRWSRCGPMPTYGPETTTAPGPSSTPFSVLLRTLGGLRGRPMGYCAGQRPKGLRLLSWSPRRSRRSRRFWPAAGRPQQRPTRPWCHPRRRAWWPR